MQVLAMISLPMRSPYPAEINVTRYGMDTMLSATPSPSNIWSQFYNYWWYYYYTPLIIEITISGDDLCAPSDPPAMPEKTFRLHLLSD